MKKKNKKLIWGLAAIIILAALYAVVMLVTSSQEKEQQQAAKSEAESAIVVQIPADEASGIAFQGKSGEISFEKKEDTWYCVQDPEMKVNQDKIASLLGDVEGLSSTRVLENVEDLSDYGLEAPENTITITETDGESVEIRLGIRNTSTSELYFQTGDAGDTVYMTSTALDRHYTGELADFAVYEEFPSIEGQYMRQFDVDKKENSYVLVMTGDDKCTVIDEDGEEQSANLNVVGTVQDYISNLSWYKNLEYNCKDLSAYGLDDPQMTLTVRYLDGEDEKTVKLELGDTDENGDYYARMNDLLEVHTVRADYVEYLVKAQASSYWSLTYSFVSIGDLDQLEVTSEGETYTLEKKALTGETDDSSAAQYLVNGQSVAENYFTDFYYACVSVTAQERLDTVPEFTEDPVLKLKYTLTDGTEKEISYYDEGDQNFYTVVYEGETKAAHTNKLYVNMMLEALDALKEVLQ